MDEYLDKVILIGLSFFDENEELIEQYQTHGTITKIKDGLIIIERKNGSFFSIPFDTESINHAEPGIYTEHSSGIKIEDPDYLSQWSVMGIKDSKNIEVYKSSGFSN